MIIEHYPIKGRGGESVIENGNKIGMADDNIFGLRGGGGESISDNGNKVGMIDDNFIGWKGGGAWIDKR